MSQSVPSVHVRMQSQPLYCETRAHSVPVGQPLLQARVQMLRALLLRLAWHARPEAPPREQSSSVVQRLPSNGQLGHHPGSMQDD